MDSGNLKEDENTKVKRNAEVVQKIGVDFRSTIASEERGFEREISFAERLMLLDGGTLTLTFTALGFLGTRLNAGHSVVDIRLLFWSWSLLVGAMIGALISQRLLVDISSWCISHAHGNLVRAGMDALSPRLRQYPQVDVYEWSGSITDLFGMTVPYVATRMRLKRVFLPLSELATISAFILMLIFVEANIQQMLGTAFTVPTQQPAAGDHQMTTPAPGSPAAK